MHNQQSIDYSSVWIMVLLFKDPTFLFMVEPKESPFALRAERERERNHNICISTNKQKPHLPI